MPTAARDRRRERAPASLAARLSRPAPAVWLSGQEAAEHVGPPERGRAFSGQGASQIEGEPLAELGRPAPERPPKELADHLDGYRAHHITVELRRFFSGWRATVSVNDRIVLDIGADPGERLATLAHELSHREEPDGDVLMVETRDDRTRQTSPRSCCAQRARSALTKVARCPKASTARNRGCAQREFSRRSAKNRLTISDRCA